MSCNIIPTPSFARSLKALMKRYKSMRNDYDTFENELRKTPVQGTDLGNGLRKIRMSIASKGRGKAGGARVITYNVLTKELDGDVYLLEIYDKSDASNVKMNVIRAMVKNLNL